MKRYYLDDKTPLSKTYFSVVGILCIIFCVPTFVFVLDFISPPKYREIYDFQYWIAFGWVILPTLLIIPKSFQIFTNAKHKCLRRKIQKKLDLKDLDEICPRYDVHAQVASRQALKNYTEIKFFKANPEVLDSLRSRLDKKREVAKTLEDFLASKKYCWRYPYFKIKKEFRKIIENADKFSIEVDYITYAGNHLDSLILEYDWDEILEYQDDPTLMMTKGELNKYRKEQTKIALDEKHHEYYGKINSIIDFANENRDELIIKGSRVELDNLVYQLFDRTINSVKKIKNLDSEEWRTIKKFIDANEKEIKKVVKQNQRLLDYYNSERFSKIKNACQDMMDSQKEFNDYINKKVESISQYFGRRVTRNETVINDVNNYIRPYKKSVTPFTAEVSATVFASAENNPLAYVVKNFYPDKKTYPEQIKKLQFLIEELETLKDAKQILDNYKKDYQKYLKNVPNYVMDNDESGFYSRLGFANVDENELTVEYEFSYTSNGGFARRSFKVPMTEETIVELIGLLQSKLTAKAFAKEQRNLMTNALRNKIKERDNFTCCMCGNSVEKEPNLLLEIDHVKPVSKGGCTVEDNLQTLCWKCNRTKGDKLIV